MRACRHVIESHSWQSLAGAPASNHGFLASNGALKHPQRMAHAWFVASMLVLHFEALRGCAATSDTPFTGRICPPVGPLASLTWALPANLLILASTALEQGLLAVLASDRRCVMTCLKFDGSFAAMCE